jgi:hypothetical protein
VTNATPAAATAMPTSCSGVSVSPNIAQAMAAVVGGTRKNRADTRDAAPRRISR